MSDATKPNDGGPAFPVPLFKGPDGSAQTPGSWVAGGDGMSLRDYFAAKAMAAMLASPETFHHDCARIAAGAYGYADALLAERSRR